MRFGIELAAGAVTAILTVGCAGSSTTAPSTNALHADVSDPAGDAVASPVTANPPDLIHASVDVSAGTVTFTIQFATGSFDRQSTRATIELDTDQNPATGVQGAAGVGIDYILDLWAPRTQVTVQQAAPAACASGGSCYSDVGGVALNAGADSMAATVPLAMLGNASGHLNYRVFAYATPQSTSPTVVADVMPDINLAPAHVP